jgi:drug/metabolite transporter (DMT)-like permease
MVYLILCIISSSLIFTTFKIAGKRGIDNYSLITINYFVAAIFGFVLGGIPDLKGNSSGWLLMAIIIGILFIAIFIVMAMATQKSGIAVSTIASKMSVIIPITFSLIYFNEGVSIYKILAIILALIAVTLTIYRYEKRNSLTRSRIALPIILFLGSGTIDSLLKYSQEVYIGSDQAIQFSSFLFSIAAISGVVILLFRPESMKTVVDRRVIIAGILLGIINFGSLFGLISALESNYFDSSILFGINNIGIVLLSVIIAFTLFKEKLLLVNKIGIVLSVIAILILSMV